MEYDLINTHCADDGEPSATHERIPTEQSTPDSLLLSPMYSEMSVPALAAQCLRELEHSRQDQPSGETYAVELFRRATVQDNQEARVWVHYCFGEIVRGWLQRHPNREAACRLESEEYYVVQAFERFWQATVSTQRLEFSQLAAALQYLRASLNGAILERLRVFARAREVGLPEHVEPAVEDGADSNEGWGVFKTMLSNPREQRLAYLLFNCGLKPGEIIHFYPREFSDVREIYQLRSTIIERFLRNAD